MMTMVRKYHYNRFLNSIKKNTNSQKYAVEMARDKFKLEKVQF
jgi:hypothetical protein